MGKLIVLEGLDGSGKTTQANILAQSLEGLGKRVYLVREPGGTYIGEKLRAILDDPFAEPHPITSLFLYAASRSQLAPLIRREMDHVDFVICDRFAPSTLAYQIGGMELDKDAVEQVVNLSTVGVTPDLILYLDIRPHVARERRISRGKIKLADMYPKTFYQRVSDYYRSLEDQYPQWITVDANRPIPEVAHTLLSLVMG